MTTASSHFCIDSSVPEVIFKFFLSDLQAREISLVTFKERFMLKSIKAKSARPIQLVGELPFWFSRPLTL